MPISTTNWRQLLAEAQNLLRKGQFAAAEPLLNQVLPNRPNNAEALVAMGIVYNYTHRSDQAVDLFKRALATQPYLLNALANLAAAYHLLYRHEEAIATFRQALIIKPDDPELLYNLGTVLSAAAQYEAAIPVFRRAIELNPNYPEAFYNLGNVLHALGKTDEAQAAFERALILNPRHAEACNNLGHLFKLKGDYQNAFACFRRAMPMRPDYVDPCVALADLLRESGQLDEAAALYHHARRVNPNDAIAAEAAMFALDFLPNLNPQEIFAAHRAWGHHFTDPIVPSANHPNDRNPDRRLRVGYLSPDFRSHSVAYFIEGLLQHHNPQAVEIFCYADVSKPDEVTARFEKLSHHWSSTRRLNNQQLSELIRNDQIDILVDLAGHTGGNRLLALAQRLAPIQFSTLGYIDTTGMTQIDYRFVDAFTDPPGQTEAFHTESLIRLPKTFAAYTPPPSDLTPPIGPLPALANGFTIFGSFGSVAKINAPLIDAYASILNRTPNSRLLFASSHFTYLPTQDRIAALFAKKGITRDRLEFIGFQPLPDYLALHNRIDILLDTFPANGHTITCHALWMGVPAVSQAGAKYINRLGASVLSNLGLQPLIAHSSEQFADIAVKLASDLDTLKTLRQTLRSRLLASPIMDHTSYAHDVESVYRTLWQRWITENPQSHA